MFGFFFNICRHGKELSAAHGFVVMLLLQPCWHRWGEQIHEQHRRNQTPGQAHSFPYFSQGSCVKLLLKCAHLSPRVDRELFAPMGVLCSRHPKFHPGNPKCSRHRALTVTTTYKHQIKEVRWKATSCPDSLNLLCLTLERWRRLLIFWDGPEGEKRNKKM